MHWQCQDYCYFCPGRNQAKSKGILDKNIKLKEYQDLKNKKYYHKSTSVRKFIATSIALIITLIALITASIVHQLITTSSPPRLDTLSC